MGWGRRGGVHVTSPKTLGVADVTDFYTFYTITMAAPTRHPPDGPLIGTLQASGRVEVFLGIPFAKPPVGSLRWQPPQPPKSWTAPRLATTSAPACPQSATYYPPVGARSEDCLYLNVFTAVNVNAGKQNPVMVYLHGGSFTNGGANEDRLNASFTVDKQPNLVVVVIQYRLGVLGFSGGHALGGATSGNYGVQDQRAALQWVRRSIHAFGGDPSRVLLAGQSAGAGSVSVQLVLKRSAGLFSRALILSGAFGHWITQSLDQADVNLKTLARAVGCAPDTGVDAVCLRTRDAMFLVNKTLSIGYGPTTHTEELADEPWALAQARGGLAPGVPIILGSTAEDGTSPQAAGGVNASGVQLRSWVHTYFGPSGLSYSAALVANLTRTYASSAALNSTRIPNGKGSPAYWRSIRLLADAEMACPARRAAQWRTASAHAAMTANGAVASAYWYLWGHSPVYGTAGNMRCAYHASDIPFLFHVLKAKDRQYQLNSPEEVVLSSQLLGYVASFAETGVPSVRGAPRWAAFDDSSQSRLLLRAEGAEGGVRLESRSGNVSDYWEQMRVCELWDAIGDRSEPII